MKNKLNKLNSILMVILLFGALGVSSLTAYAKQPLIVIDPGCQAIENNQKDSIGPGEWTRKSEDMVGAKGTVTGNNEYDINLLVALKAKDLLSENGYKVELTRTTNDINMNNPDRAMVANTLSADLFISIHASNPNSDKSEMVIVCQTKDNPFNFANYQNSRLLADALLGSLVEKTSARDYKVVESDDLLGINWSTVPNVVVDIGNMNNPEDDEKLADEEYQKKIAEGILSGVDSYFSQK